MPATEFERDVSATLDELAAWIAKAYPDAERRGAGDHLIADRGAVLELVATPGPERRIALLRLPTLRIRYRFTAGGAEACAALLHRLDLFMHRGGG
ncbi:MAG: hypothetical protein H6945_20355 [Zoogloeaceae bacterium]|nr:hypothetical protein [Rhodocyclaceae bacterium]MCP5238085.1 hypothetical protein [Zoogloeaceae bacterium]